MQNLTQTSLRSLIKKTGRHSDGGGLYFRVIGGGKSYWTYRYRVGGKERETSIGPYPEITLDEARNRHAALRKQVRTDKIDPLAQKRAAKAAIATPSVKPTFGQCADAHVAAHEASWRSPKSAEAWRMTLTAYCAAIRATPVDQVDTEAVLSVLTPLWTRAPETASRLRARIEAVLASAQVDGHIHPDRTNPARWKGWLDRKLPNPKKIGKIDPITGVRSTERGHHAAMPYDQVPAFMARLRVTPGTAAKALAFLILTAARSDEVLGMPWSEVDLDAATWTVPKERMKKGKRAHRVPLSAPAMAILRSQMAERGKNPHVFPSHLPRQALSNTSVALVMRRLGARPSTVHGFRSSFRDWAGDETHFQREVAEAALSHLVGDKAEQAYRRGDALDKRRELMDAWAAFVTPTAKAAKVVPMRRRERV